MKNVPFHLFLLSIFSITVTAQAQSAAVHYTDEQQALTGFVSVPSNNNAQKAGILILPAWMGIDAHAKESAEKLTALGYYTFVADIYGDGNQPENREKAAEQSGFYKKNPAVYLKRIQLALDQLIKAGADPTRIAVIGYCFGGMGALEAARANLPVRGVITFHGDLKRDPARLIGKIAPKVLVCHGADDPYISEASIKDFQQEMRESQADWQMIYYANAVHAFTEKAAGNDNSKGAAYNETADKRSWALMLQFLTEIMH
jgi:dienelactone hydrolase